MARTPVLAAGGIVLRRESPPRIAVVRLRKRNEWVLPKGKLDDGETPRAAAEREVLEETGHAVDVHEFLGTLVYESGGRSKVVHYWRMDAGGRPVRELMSDIREVDWLPLEQALERLSRSYERTFLENVGPIALQSAALAERERRARLRAVAAERRKSRLAEQAPAVEGTPVVDRSVVAEAPGAAEVAETPEVVAHTEPEAPVTAPQEAAADAGDGIESEQAAGPAAPATSPSFAPEIAPIGAAAQPILRKNLLDRVRDWLRRAA
ncbi:putative 8-oxo-dGTP diphosphatase 1 [Bradyrhizobium ivorense]|uniref:8-oxo-dGTP diphosphatase 1 n=1 Tax=Bradyrhizobium ivorense TaxID=2511166 RepID=A0A508TU51_9BRAD|nr:NUDIX hydrolase [Bradyrhizobium ivorense]VIO67451.1 putative 8-oxo-dGTP diphosphatase 1 [Bradyrhizobium ivorense]VIO77881.1 putative 8-oxo-dGTP diphosphatase 1 [Bradyrhizobium ivorense]